MRYFNRNVAVLCGFCILVIAFGALSQYRLKRNTVPPSLEWMGPAVLAAEAPPETTNQTVADATPDNIAPSGDALCICASTSDVQHLVDINNATAAELIQLPGIGPAYAERIIAMRTLRGGFVYVEELLEVSGIGPARFAQLAPLVFIGPYGNADE